MRADAIICPHCGDVNRHTFGGSVQGINVDNCTIQCRACGNTYKCRIVAGEVVDMQEQAA